jgi:hypothetical protein
MLISLVFVRTAICAVRFAGSCAAKRPKFTHTNSPLVYKGYNWGFPGQGDSIWRRSVESMKRWLIPCKLGLYLFRC